MENYIPTIEEIEFVRIMMDEGNGNPFYPPKLVSEALRLSKIFHYLAAIKFLQIKDGKEFGTMDISDDSINKIIAAIKVAKNDEKT